MNIKTTPTENNDLHVYTIYCIRLLSTQTKGQKSGTGTQLHRKNIAMKNCGNNSSGDTSVKMWQQGV